MTAPRKGKRTTLPRQRVLPQPSLARSAARGWLCAGILPDFPIFFFVPRPRSVSPASQSIHGQVAPHAIPGPGDPCANSPNTAGNLPTPAPENRFANGCVHRSSRWEHRILRSVFGAQDGPHGSAQTHRRTIASRIAALELWYSKDGSLDVPDVSSPSIVDPGAERLAPSDYEGFKGPPSVIRPPLLELDPPDWQAGRKQSIHEFRFWSDSDEDPRYGVQKGVPR